jgi:hypothetical protein
MAVEWLRGAAMLGLGLAATACSRPANPVVAHDPLPPPSLAYAARCYASWSIFHGRPAACLPIVAPAALEERTVVRARG